MNIKILIAIIAITLALIFYTVGVFSERKSGILKKEHIILFIIGLIFDTTGTTLMSTISTSGSLFTAHGITGALAIILMLFHAIWAIITYKKNDPKKLKDFHKLSIVIWAIWLIPYLLGVFMGMMH